MSLLDKTRQALRRFAEVRSRAGAPMFIDQTRYPISQDTAERAAVIAEVRTQLAQDGCAVLKGFLTPQGIAALIAEAEQVADKGHHSQSRTNAYFTQDDPSLPEDDPRRQFFDRSNAFIPADNFARSGALRQVHDAPGFDAFIQDCLQETQFYRYADPLADVIVNMATAGNGFPWHFDTNNFTVTLAIQNAEEGGAFEYAAGIREGDENFAEVARVLNGTSDRVTRLELEPGDLQLFRGRYSLHRVAPLKGTRPRYVAIFSYVEEPGMVGAPERTQQLYGRTLPIHFERAGRRKDAYID
ncbi:MAG: phytanoyl-CoA dioxygenase family protein [Roseovarius sp.]